MNWYHPIFGDALTIPNGIWQTFLTILGAAIGASVAGWIAVKTDRARKLDASRDEFAAFMLPLLENVKLKQGIDVFWGLNIDGIRAACLKLGVHLDARARGALNEALKTYCDIKTDELKPTSIPQGVGTGARQDYTAARKTFSDPLIRMLEIAKRSA